jgi:glyoxylase-like metal-dependent hydrolase (beta-lactamase superfamily II)
VRPVAAGWGDDERQLTGDVTLLAGPANGAYPSGNTLLVRGASETVLIDPSVTVVERGVTVRVDAVVNSHSHEDHVAGNGAFPAARVHVHDADLPGVRSLEGLLDVYGLQGAPRAAFGDVVVDEFHYAPRPDATGFTDGHVFDIGGGVTIEAVHLPGHTRGHSGFRISGGVFFLSDIDLTGFGPYYGDAWSDLEDFTDSLARVREEEADTYVTFHHKGVIEGRDAFLRLLDDFTAVIDRRHAAMLDFLAEPRSLEEMAAHRFVYRPHVQHVFADAVERRTAELHVARMLHRGEAGEVEPGRYQRT